MSPRQNADSIATPSNSTTRSAPALSRRTVIAGGGTVALASLAGCSAIVNQLAEMALKEVNIFNGAERSVSGTIEIVDPNDEVVLGETFDLKSESDSSEDADTNDGVAQYGDVWTDTGDYEVSIELEETLADDPGTGGNETESTNNSSDVETTNSTDSQTSADNESASNSSESGTDAEGSESGTSATETVTVNAPDEEHLVVGIDQGETAELISFHVIEEFSELGEEYE